MSRKKSFKIFPILLSFQIILLASCRNDDAPKDDTNNKYNTVKPITVKAITVKAICQPNCLYAVNAEDNSISSYTINSNSGALTVNGKPFSTGVAGSIRWMAPNAKGTLLFVASDKSVVSFAIDRSTGNLKKIATSPEVLTHALPTLDSTGNFLYMPDHGQAQIRAYSVATGSFTEISGSPFSFLKGALSLGMGSGGFLYVARSSGEVGVYKINSTTGELTPASNARMPPVDPGIIPDAMYIDDVKFFYEFSDTVMILDTRGSKLAITYRYSLKHDQPGRSIEVLGPSAPSPAGNLLTVYDIDPKTGALVRPRHTAIPDASLNSRIVFDPNGNTVAIFAKNVQSFELSKLAPTTAYSVDLNLLGSSKVIANVNINNKEIIYQGLMNAITTYKLGDTEFVDTAVSPTLVGFPIKISDSGYITNLTTVKME